MILAVFILAGCTETNDIANGWKESAVFELSGITGDGQDIKSHWIGEQVRVAITNNPFVVDKDQKYMWLFWGNEKELVGKKFEVLGTSEQGEEKSVFSGSLGGANWTAQASHPSLIALPSKGLWKLDAYVEKVLYGSIIVSVS